MKFIDIVNITVIAGSGGNGWVSFDKKRRNKKFILKVNSSNGGDGGSIWLTADSNLNTLNYFYFNRVFRAENGFCGSNRGCTGKRGKDMMIRVPWGTRVTDQKTKKLLGNIGQYQKCLMVAKGGGCGLGNKCFKYSPITNKFIRTSKAIYGASGERQHLLLELMLVADVGVFGLPNSGKSSFVNAVSEAKSKVASYPFTTLTPCLGVVQVDHNSKFVIADIPGIIKGASVGLGLGIRFLRHLEHCRILLHFVDVAPVDNSDPVSNIIIVEREIYKYSNKLVHKPRWLVFNKIDLLNRYEVEDKIRNIIKSVSWTGPYYYISSIYNINISLLCSNIMKYIAQNR